MQTKLKDDIGGADGFTKEKIETFINYDEIHLIRDTSLSLSKLHDLNKVAGT